MSAERHILAIMTAQGHFKSNAQPDLYMMNSQEAAGSGAQLVVLPEMWICPYSNDSFGPYAEDIDGAASQVLCMWHASGLAAAFARVIFADEGPPDHRSQHACIPIQTLPSASFQTLRLGVVLLILVLAPYDQHTRRSLRTLSRQPRGRRR